MAKNENITNSLENLQKSQPSVAKILNPPKRPPELADANPYPCSLAAQRAVGNFFVWKDAKLNEDNRYMEVLNSFQCFKADQQYLSREQDPEKDKPTERLALAFVSFRVALAEDQVTRIVTKIPHQEANIGSATRFVDAAEFLAAAEISNEAGSLAREAEDTRRSLRGPGGSLVRM